ncbi:hypothetical protein TNCV_3374701 [Trichonephila clavipes]|nr:hypothetical protein TNCV_3374701 [Trichonephila clavipes]
MNSARFARHSRGAIYPPQNQTKRQTLTQISRYFSKPSHTSDATPYMLAEKYGIVRSPIQRNTGKGVCGGVISIWSSTNITRRRSSWHDR